MERSKDAIIPVVEETLEVGKDVVKTGRVTVTKYVSEREEVVDEPLVVDRVEVERVPVDVFVDAPVPSREEGDTLILPVLEEVLVFEKRLLLKEEIHIRRVRTEVRKPQAVRVRSEDVVIDRRVRVMEKVIVGLFDQKADAELVARDLESAGISRSDIELVDQSTMPTTAAADRPSFWDKFKSALGFGPPIEDQSYFSEGLRRGGTLVVVEAAEQDDDRIRAIMETHNVVDINERGAKWREAGWKPSALEGGEEAKMPVAEEELSVGKRVVRTGGVRVYHKVTERPVEQDVELREEHVRVERRPVDRPLRAGDEAAFQEGSIELTETAEEPVVAKRAKVVEEVVVGKDVGTRTETIRDTLRRADVQIEELGKSAIGGPTDLDETDFRSYMEQNYRGQDVDYDKYAPAYRLGQALAPRYSEWSLAEPEAKRLWATSSIGPWDKFSNLVRYSWEKALARSRMKGARGA